MTFSYETIKNELLIDLKNCGTFHILYDYLYMQKKDKLISNNYYFSDNLFRFNLVEYEDREIFKVEIGCDNIFLDDPLNENIFYIDICMNKYDKFYCNEINYDENYLVNYLENNLYVIYT